MCVDSNFGFGEETTKRSSHEKVVAYCYDMSLLILLYWSPGFISGMPIDLCAGKVVAATLFSLQNTGSGVVLCQQSSTA